MKVYEDEEKRVGAHAVSGWCSLKSFLFLVRTLGSRVFDYATMEDRYFFNFLSPAIRSLRLVDGFVRNVFVLMSGATIAMIVPLLATPLLTRLYTPEDYGIFALYLSIVLPLSVLITGNYELALMLPKRDEEAFNLLSVCASASLLIGAGFLLASSFLAGHTASLLGSSLISTWLPLAPVLAFIIGLQQTFSYWANRKKQFKSLGANKIVESIVTPVASTAFGFCSWGVGGLVVGLLGGKIVATWMLGRGVWRAKTKSKWQFKVKLMLLQARRYADFPLVSTPASLLDLLALQIPILLLTRSFGPSVVGLFALSNRVIGAPLALVGSCVAQVYYQWTAEARHRNDDLRSYVVKVAGYLSLIVAGPLVAAVLFSPSLFSVLFGEQWRIAGEYARILVFPLAARFIVSPLAVIMPASGNVKLGAVWKIGYFCSTAVVLYVASSFQPRTFLYIYGAHELVLWGVNFLVILRASADVRSTGGDAAEVLPEIAEAKE
jgi:O-antigen/teichoic acid export membrane protein